MAQKTIRYETTHFIDRRSSAPLQTPSFVWIEALSDMISCLHRSYPGNCRRNPNPNSCFAPPTPTPQGGGYRICSHDHASHRLVTEDHRWATLWLSEASPVPTSTEIPSITNNSPERNATPCVCQSESSYTWLRRGAQPLVLEVQWPCGKVSKASKPEVKNLVTGCPWKQSGLKGILKVKVWADKRVVRVQKIRHQ